MLALMLAALMQSAATPEIVHDGGVCVGLSWVHLASREQVVVEPGPDFDIYRFHGPDGEDDSWWAVYSGRYANAKAQGPTLVERDGVVVRRAVKDAQFTGYLAEKEGLQNHFFGSIFKDQTSDLALFSRVEFGPAGQSLCAKIVR